MRKQKKNTILLDKAGMLLSGLCAIHCSVLPILIVLGVGTSFGWMLSHEVELVFLTISLAIASYSLVQGYIKVHRHLGVLLLAIFGFMFLIVGHEVQAFSLSIILSTFGGLSILFAHLLNFRFRSRGVILASNQ